MAATDSILALSKQEVNKVGQNSSLKGKTGRKARNKSKVNTIGKAVGRADNSSANALFEVIDKFACKKSGPDKQGDIAEALLLALNGKNNDCVELRSKSAKDT